MKQPRVTRLSTIPISIPLEAPKGGSAHPLGPTFLTHCLVRIDTDAGVTGYGEISDGWGCEYAKVADTIVTEAIARFVVDQDPRQPDELIARARAWFRRRQGTMWLISQALSGVEIALWDITGKLADKPIYELFGGTGSPVNVYAAGNFLSQGTAAVHKEHFSRFLSQGAKATKLRLGPRWQEEIDVLREFRKLIGPGIAIFLDGNEAFSLKTATQIAPLLAECGVGFFEEPCVRDDPVGLAQFVKSSPVSIAYGEHVFGVSGFLEMFEDRVTDIWQPDAAVCGGISELRRIAAVAAARNVRVSPHSAATPIGLAANLHAVSGAPTLTFQEMGARMDGHVPHFKGGDAVSTARIENGTLRPPAGPGLGIEPNEDIATRFPYREPPKLGSAPALYQGSV